MGTPLITVSALSANARHPTTCHSKFLFFSLFKIGKLWRIFAVATQGVCWYEPDGSAVNEYYYVSIYNIAYSMDGTNWQFYTDDQGNTMV